MVDVAAIRNGNKIKAIKVLRDLVAAQPTLIEVTDTFGRKRMAIDSGISLKDAKDFVEAVMELGVRQLTSDHAAIAAKTREERYETILRDYAILGDYYNGRISRRECMENLMAINDEADCAR